MASTHKRSVAVTGAGSGLGRNIALGPSGASKAAIEVLATSTAPN
jgi:NADP-dependent 3-hydroxy acid dehydrogenase YdfG